MHMKKSAAQLLPKCSTSPHGVLLVEHGNVWNVCRAFVTSTRPLQKQVDKETAEKVKQAAEAITEGIKEARHTGKFVKETVSANAGTVVSEMAKKAIEKASEDDDGGGKENTGAWQKVKEAVNGKGKGE